MTNYLLSDVKVVDFSPYTKISKKSKREINVLGHKFLVCVLFERER